MRQKRSSPDKRRSRLAACITCRLLVEGSVKCSRRRYQGRRLGECSHCEDVSTGFSRWDGDRILVYRHSRDVYNPSNAFLCQCQPLLMSRSSCLGATDLGFFGQLHFDQRQYNSELWSVSKLLPWRDLTL